MHSRLFAAAAIFAVFTATGAFAHADLVKSEPAANATIAAPHTVRLAFSEDIELGFSGILLLDPAGKAVTVTNPRLDGANHKVLLIDVPALQPGAYRVKWHNVAVDTHRLEGDYAFTVKN